MKNNHLAIAIPTYNRADILKENILYMMADLKKHNIPIYISDDSDNDDTKHMISSIKKNYEYLYYHKNIHRLGHDKNCFAALNLPSEKYISHLGDALFFEKGAIDFLVHVINNYDVDLIFVNMDLRNLDFDSGIKKNKNNILLELGWHLTLTGVTTFSEKSLDYISKLELNKIRNFPHFALIFKILSENKKAYWINEKLISGNKKKKSYWEKDAFKIFLFDWENVVKSLDDSYLKANKEQCILNHSKYTKLFGFRSMLKLRRVGTYNKQVLYEYRRMFKRYTILPYPILFIISIIPANFFQSIKKIKDSFLFVQNM